MVGLTSEWVHHTSSGAKIEGGNDMVQVELEAKVKALKEYKLLKEDLEAQIASIEEEIKAELAAREVEELVAGPFKIRWTKFITNRFDTAAFKTMHKDIYDLFVKPQESRRFSVA
jgi:predicted phage-related endonuclease